MPLYLRALAVCLALVGAQANADLLSYHNANPLGWAHLLPVGETPGWSQPMWINLEINEANVWSVPFTMTDRRNGYAYTYRADYEQTSAIADIGFALTPHLAFSVEVPYANHNGGFLDDFIDQFHILIQTDRFERNDYPKYGNLYSATKNGQNVFSSSHAEGVGGFKLKLKYWILRWTQARPGVCDCGLSAAFHVKFPVQPAAGGLSDGSNDYTGMINFGIPLWSYSGIWFSTALTKLGHDSAFDEWPLRSWSQMYEAMLTLAFTENWGLVLGARYESPLMRNEDLSFNYHYRDGRDQEIERENSSWNSLVYWRGSETIGFRYLMGQNGSQVNFLFVEDWALGTNDSSGGWTYINNAPDAEFLTQFHFEF